MPFIGNGWTSNTAAATSDLPDVASIVDKLSSSQPSNTAKRFSFGTVVPFRGSSRSQKYRNEKCPKGQDYYACQSTGFEGCCSRNACDPKVVCPENNESKLVASRDVSSEPTSNSVADIATLASTKVSSIDDTTTGNLVSRSETLTVNPSITSATDKAAQALMSATVIQARDDISLAPSCPGGNGTRYTDNLNIAYTVRCGYDSTAVSYNEVSVSTGGYAQCFSSCSSTGDCAGFTFVGLNDGTCYLKSRLLRRLYVAKEGNNYISCNKLDRLASATNSTTSATESSTSTSTPASTKTAVASTKQPNKGAIAGGVVGGIAIIALMLFLVACLARRRRKNLESKRATVTHIFGGAMEPDSNALPLHTRNGSTGLFTPYGGYQRNTGGTSIARDYANQSATTSPASSKSRPPMYPDSMPSHPVTDGKADSLGAFMLPPTTYQPPKNSSTERVPMLDSTSIPQTTTRSPRFHEHISEMADTSSPPPTLTPNTLSRKRWGSVLYADQKHPNLSSPEPTLDISGNDGRMAEARKRQEQLHLMSWNNYQEGRAAEPQGNGAGVAATIGREKARPTERGLERKEGEISPDQTESPMDPRFVISL